MSINLEAVSAWTKVHFREEWSKRDKQTVLISFYQFSKFEYIPAGQSHDGTCLETRRNLSSGNVFNF